MDAREFMTHFWAMMGARARQQFSEPSRPAPARSAAINRWTGKPHDHAREKARRLKQWARA